jgi:hypothetical protein
VTLKFHEETSGLIVASERNLQATNTFFIALTVYKHSDVNMSSWSREFKVVYYLVSFLYQHYLHDKNVLKLVTALGPL